MAGVDNPRTGLLPPATEVCITVDVEFNIAGHISEPEKYKPVGVQSVICAEDRREHGLGFMLEQLSEYDCPATFFVETLNRSYFGDAPMQGIMDRILSAQQDVQLHVHPVWLRLLPEAESASFTQNDCCDGRSAEELYRVFSQAESVFRRWSGKGPEAIRTGNLRADLSVYRATAALGIPLASNIGLGVFRPPEKALHLLNGRHTIEQVLEIPVFSYQDLNLPRLTRAKSLQITSCSTTEMECVLWTARAAGAQTVVVLTHPFEFAKRKDFQFSRVTRNRVNQERFKHLLRFVKNNPEHFIATSFGASGHSWLAGEDVPAVRVSTPSHYAITRMIHNKINDLVWRY